MTLQCSRCRMTFFHIPLFPDCKAEFPLLKVKRFACTPGWLFSFCSGIHGAPSVPGIPEFRLEPQITRVNAAPHCIFQAPCENNDRQIMLLQDSGRWPSGFEELQFHIRQRNSGMLACCRTSLSARSISGRKHGRDIVFQGHKVLLQRRCRLCRLWQVSGDPELLRIQFWSAADP